ncbi:hypothetical protein B0H17DRAFT_1132751 [Mycena rosella]|uniref:Uncharacterized protein n=1 Tax=Mycena rosella TaxID=1033263 RepID=A0AAD7DK12_MYCRO|nr:hypothetical protein B0H17DRAFT_1132751 [Mycena rosella]
MTLPASWSSHNPFRLPVIDPWSPCPAAPPRTLRPLPQQPPITPPSPLGPFNAAYDVPDALPRVVYPPIYPPHPHHHEHAQHCYIQAPDIHSSVSGHVASIGPVLRVYPVSLAGWADDDKLALERENWLPFKVKVRNTLGMSPGAWRFIEDAPEDPNICPSFQMFPAHHRAWVDTDRVMSFLNEVLIVTERTYIENCKSAKETWQTLRLRHEFRGPTGQIAALKKFSSIVYSSDPSTYAATTTLLNQTSDKIWQCGPPDPEQFLLAGIINVLIPNNPALSDALLGQKASRSPRQRSVSLQSRPLTSPRVVPAARKCMQPHHLAAPTSSVPILRAVRSPLLTPFRTARARGGGWRAR